MWAQHLKASAHWRRSNLKYYYSGTYVIALGLSKYIHNNVTDKRLHVPPLSNLSSHSFVLVTQIKLINAVHIANVKPALAGRVYPDCLGIGRPNYSYKIYAATLYCTHYVTSPTSITAF